MKKLFLSLLLVCAGMAFSGCELFDTDVDEDDDYVFLNKSTYNITVIPTAQSGWSTFSFGPGETYRLDNVDDLYYVFEPRFRVEVADSDDGRIVFINYSDRTESGSTQ